MNSKRISDKLLVISQQNKMNHQMLLIRFFHERFLYRLSKSKYKNTFLLKGGNLIYALQGEIARPTVDIDFLAIKIPNDLEKIQKVFDEIISIQAEDFVDFRNETLKLHYILEANKYSGIRISLEANLGNIKQMLHIDIGYGDTITPSPIDIEFPTILMEFESAKIMAYTIETLVAEKLHAMLSLAQLNSRMKDFYDIYQLIKTNRINSNILKIAIKETFENRNTIFSLDSVVFSDEFYEDANRKKQWKLFVNKMNQPDLFFDEVIISLRNYLHTTIFIK